MLAPAPGVMRHTLLMAAPARLNTSVAEHQPKALGFLQAGDAAPSAVRAQSERDWRLWLMQLRISFSRATCAFRLAWTESIRPIQKSLMQQVSITQRSDLDALARRQGRSARGRAGRQASRALPGLATGAQLGGPGWPSGCASSPKNGLGAWCCAASLCRANRPPARCNLCAACRQVSRRPTRSTPPSGELVGSAAQQRGRCFDNRVQSIGVNLTH